MDIVRANRHGQQLSFANMGRRRHPRRYRPGAVLPERRRADEGQQLGLFDPRPSTWASRHGFPEPSKTARTAALDTLVRDHTARHGWSTNTTKRTRLAVRVLLNQQRTPGQPIRASDVVQLAKTGLTAAPVLAVLTAAGLLDDDRIPAILPWFDRQSSGLPPVMTDELRAWFDILRQGSTVPPRSRPRALETVELRIRFAVPALRAWAAEGYASLREISPRDVIAVLPETGHARSLTVTALRSMFRTLKAHKIVFINPTSRITVGAAERPRPLPMDLEKLRTAINSADPACAALAALLAFHGVRPEQLRQLQLTDIHDGRLHLHHGTVLLAAPVRDRVVAWLDYRCQRWPNTANPHVFIHYRTATSIGPIGGTWIGRRLGIAANTIRIDRILDEVNATDGDVRRLCDLFGLSVKAAFHYVEPLDRPGALDSKTAQP